ncbi:GerMN domain-containing protein [Oryzomonas sagensis]|uniref:GerMN domain-containing protein n=1 Tax=Oryzomonas sagensis TaxID=2603857 RepID=A0ABQ6TTD9_9BACT|nr:GerMN domain-containing protein [Oryzomonas sagensis]KAB0672318.1 GerMN domain-containing protein [Oryzomonas sagensis]
MPSVRRKRVNIGLVLPFLVIALAFGGMLWRKYQTSYKIPTAPQTRQQSGTRTVVLFFVADGTRLVREARELESCNDTGACIKSTLAALLSGPLGDYDEALPENTGLNSVRIEGGTAVVDLSREFAADLPSGSSAEMLAVYSIVDTVCANYPQISRVKLTVEGNGSTVLNHLDLSAPLAPDYSLEQASGQAPAAAPSTPKKGK